SHEDVLEALQSLLDVATELQLESISISKTSIDSMTWTNMYKILLDLFATTDTKICTCSNDIIIPSTDERSAIVSEDHTSSFAGHKGITKTYRRIREKYFWPTLKRDVQEYVNACLSCQQKKLTRVKTRLPMTITDTSGAAFEKISMDISDWDEWLPFATFSYNTSVHEGTLFTPHELVFGTLARTPSANTMNHDSSDESYNHYLNKLQDKIKGTISATRENLDSAKHRAKKYYDRKTNIQSFAVGDSVFLLKKPRK
ncbi:uncharacterized protein LOC144478039, partial [Augochlora pura]